MARRKDLFTTIHIEGALLPPDLLQRLSEGGKELEGLSPQGYHLPGTEKLPEAINRSWNRLIGAFEAYDAAIGALPENDPGTSPTREKWLLRLFSELGYGRLPTTKAIEAGGKDYPVSHLWQALPIHLVGAGVDLDRRSEGVKGAARTSPHSLLQELLNRSPEHLWGVVSNGERLRILRDNVSLTRQAYVEFDLRAMMQGEVYSDFALLWLLCHQSRFETERPTEFLIERWKEAAHRRGTRALDRLRDGVQEAITFLGQGFLAHPQNQGLREALREGTLSTHDYYLQLLRLCYRLIFLFVAEDRDLLFDAAAPDEAKMRYLSYFSTQRLRDVASRRRGTKHPDLYQALRLVSSKLGSDEGCPELAIPALGSFLWRKEALPDLHDAELPNTHLLSSVRALAFTQEGKVLLPVDYRNMGSEELGSIYESLLEFHPELNAEAAIFTLQTATGSERKTTGSYYTPTSLISALLESALDPVLEEAASRDDYEEAIMSLKVLDPACGSGHFLVAAARRIARRLAARRTGDEEPAPEATRTAVRDVISACVYGVDVNPMAVELCKVSLWMEAVEPGRPLSFLEHKIVCGNSLLGATPRLLAGGIPDEAFKALEGDDKKVVSSLKKRNKEERKGQEVLFTGPSVAELTKPLADAIKALDAAPGASPQQIRTKEREWESLQASSQAARAKLIADAWCAAFVIEKKEGRPALTDGVLRLLAADPRGGDPQLKAEVRRLAGEYAFLHPHLAFPGVFEVPEDPEGAENPEQGWNGGFDVVVGNPPFLNQLEVGTAAGARARQLLQGRFGDVAKGYSDSATQFLAGSVWLARLGGRVALVQPQSLLAARDARPARSAILQRAVPTWIWVAGEAMFEAHVLVCSVAFHVGKAKEGESLSRAFGSLFTPLSDREIDIKAMREQDTWTPLIGEAFGALSIDLTVSGQTLADLASPTADFRDQFYGLIPFVIEDAKVHGDPARFPPLITTGLIDPAMLLWGKRPTKFAKMKWDAPRVDLDRLQAESDLGDWARARLVPKVLLATQTKVLEAVVDEAGEMLPSIPTITVAAPPGDVWKVAALLVSPPVTAWALENFGGAALATDAIKLSAKQVAQVPLPDDHSTWLQAADSFREASTTEDLDKWQKHLEESGRLMCVAFRVHDVDSLLDWWIHRLPTLRGA